MGIKKKKTVKCKSSWMNVCKKGEVYTYLKSYWFNGEGWYQLKDKDGKVFDCPDVFFLPKIMEKRT